MINIKQPFVVGNSLIHFNTSKGDYIEFLDQTRLYILQTRFALNGEMNSLDISLVVNLNKTSLFLSK